MTDVVMTFNEAINAGDLSRVEALTTDDHRVVDAAGTQVHGGVACADAWRGFLGEFPDPRLAGPARWTATVVDGHVRRWQGQA